MNEDARWDAALARARHVSEVRLGIVRVAALAAFYAWHLARRGPDAERLDAVFGALVAAWGCMAVGLHSVLRARIAPAWVRYFASLWDTAMATVAILVGTDPSHSPLVVLYFAILAAAAIRLDLRLVRVTTVAVVLAYAFVYGREFTRFHSGPKLVWPASLLDPGIVVLGLVLAGVLAGQVVRNARRFALDYGERRAIAPRSADASEGGSS